jgi:hypothetical protein
MANTEAYISAGGRANWIYIVFKHNQHQIDAAHDLAQRMGFHRFVTVDSGRFPNDCRFTFQHPNGEMHFLEQASRSAYRKGAHGAAYEADTIGDPVRASVNGIRCKSAKHNRFYLNAAGYVSPCCWVASVDGHPVGNMLKATSAAGRDPEEFNVYRRPIDEIVSDAFFSSVFKKLWRASALETCLKKCGHNHRNIRSEIRMS